MDTGTFDLDELLENARQAELLAGRLYAIPSSLGEYAGRDASRAVMVVVGPDGRLLRIDVNDSWRARLAPEEFAAAVMAAGAEALNAYSQAYGEALERAFHGIGPVAPVPAPDLGLGIDVGELFTDDLHVAFERLVRLSARADDLVTAAERADLESPAEALGMGERGMVEIRLGPTGFLTGIDIDTGWLGRCPHWMLTEELTTAVASAHAQRRVEG